MAGIDNITKEILQEARNQADKIISEANHAADAAKEQAQKEMSVLLADAESKAAADAAAYAERIDSQIGMKRRQAVLSAKQELIGEVIETAREQLAKQDVNSYFLMISKLILKHAGSGEGEILFNAADRKRLPADFIASVAKLAEAKGGKLTISDETADIEDGCILRYGGIEENCTLRALIAEKRDLLQDKAASKLW